MPIPIAAGNQGPTPLLPGQVRFGQKDQKVGYVKGSPNWKPPTDRGPVGPKPPPGQTPPILPGQTVPVPTSGGPADPASPTNFLQALNPQQQKKVQRLLGDSYDPSKPLNVQLAKATWDSLDVKGRHAWAQNQRDNGNWILDGAKMGTVHGVKDAFDEMLQHTNSMLQQEYDYTYDNMSGGGTGGVGLPISGPAWSPAEIETMRTDLAASMAANPDFATPEQVASFEKSWAAGGAQYDKAQKQGQRLQHLAARLGITPDKILPPDITERLARASLGYDQNGQPLSNVPSAADLVRYPGLAIALAGMPHYTFEEAHNAWQAAGGRTGQRPDVSRGRDGESKQANKNSAYGDGPATMVYQPAFSSDQLAQDYGASSLSAPQER